MQTLATVIALLGLFMTRLDWRWALLVWGYALAWLLVTDRVKLLAYRLYGREIKRHGNDRPGMNNRRRCEWCTQHAV